MKVKNNYSQENKMQHTSYRIVASKNVQTKLPKCSVCNSNLIVNTSRSGKYKYYKCPTPTKKDNKNEEK